MAWACVPIGSFPCSPGQEGALWGIRTAGIQAVGRGRGRSILLVRCPRCRPPGRPRLRDPSSRAGGRPACPGRFAPDRLPRPGRFPPCRCRRAASVRADADAAGRAPPGRAVGQAAPARPGDRPADPAGAGALPHRPRRGRRHRPVVAQHPAADRHRRPAHRRGRRARPARRVRVRRPGRADGPAAAAGEGHRHRPARPLARDGRPLRHHPGLRPRPADRLGLRGLRPREGDERDRHAADDLPGRADGDRRLVPAARRGRLLGPRRAPPPEVRDLVLRAPVHLPGDRARVQPPVRRRPRVPLGLPPPGWPGRPCTRRSAR